MLRSINKILTTHVGSLPRSKELAQLMVKRDRGLLSAEEASQLPGNIKSGVADVVNHQVETGLDIINDGEASKIGYATYVRDRLSGFAGVGAGLTIWDLDGMPEFSRRHLEGLDPATPACTSAVTFHGQSDLQVDIANLKEAAIEKSVAGMFMTSASPGVISLYLENQYYPTDEEYWEALGEAMRVEYEAIVAAGFILQIDAPDLAMGRHVNKKLLEIGEFRKEIGRRIEILNHACRNIPSESMRLHLCWGNYQGPHHHDAPLDNILDLILTMKASGLSFEGANPRHQHEWHVWDKIKIPEDKVLIPGVIDTCSNYVEHPDLIAERIVRYANIVGRERVVAGTDCGFANFASYEISDPKIAWMKLRALVEGAEIASNQLWKRAAA